MAACFHGAIVLQGIGAHGGGEQPGADDVVALRTQVEGVDLGEEVLVAAPAAHDLRGQRGGGPGVQHIGVAGEATGNVALGLIETGGRIGGRVHGQLGIRGQERVLVVRVAVGIQRVPDGHRHAEEALAGNQPVAVQARDPVLVARAHEGRVEVDFLAAADQAFAAVLVAATVADVPLAGGDDLEGLVALFEEVDRVHDLLRLAVEQLARRRAAQPRPPWR